MNYQFNLIIEELKQDQYDVVFHGNRIGKEAENYELLMNHKKYCFIGYSELYDFKEEAVIAINMWDFIIFFSILDGEILYYSGLKETFVGLESLENDYLIISDNSLFLINKKEYYPWGFKIVSDNIIGYDLIKNKYEIILKLDTSYELVEKLNHI